MNNIIKNKRGLELVTRHSSGYKTSSEKLHLLIYASQFMTNHSTSICPFESGKCGKEVKKLQKLEHLENEKSSLDEIKDIFHSF